MDSEPAVYAKQKRKLHFRGNCNMQNPRKTYRHSTRVPRSLANLKLSISFLFSWDFQLNWKLKSDLLPSNPLTSSVYTASISHIVDFRLEIVSFDFSRLPRIPDFHYDCNQAVSCLRIHLQGIQLNFIIEFRSVVCTILKNSNLNVSSAFELENVYEFSFS